MTIFLIFSVSLYANKFYLHVFAHIIIYIIHNQQTVAKSILYPFKPTFTSGHKHIVHSNPQ